MATAPSGIKGHEQYEQQERQRVWFGAAPVDVLGMVGAAESVLRLLEQRRGQAGREPLQIMGPNAFLVTLAAKNTSFAKALSRADLCPPDGMSVVWGARLLGMKVPERVPGGELMERLCALGAEQGLSIYLLGGLPGAASGAARVLAERYPGLQIAGTDCPEPGFEQNHEANETVRARITAAHPDLLFVALGAPKQEIWMMEPRRLWKRYLIGNAHFLAITTREWLRLRKDRAASRLLQSQPAFLGQSGSASEKTPGVVPAEPLASERS